MGLRERPQAYGAKPPPKAPKDKKLVCIGLYSVESRDREPAKPHTTTCHAMAPHPQIHLQSHSHAYHACAHAAYHPQLLSCLLPPAYLSANRPLSVHAHAIATHSHTSCPYSQCHAYHTYGAVIERHGQCGDGMCSIIKLLSGDGELDLMQEDTSFTAPSRTTYVAQHLVFAAVMADAAMVYEFVERAVFRVPRRATGVGRS